MPFPDASECFYCKLTHEKVEAAGVYYCPNPLCPGPGGFAHRAKLDSYQDVDGERHTVDEAEWLEKGLRWADETGDGSIIAVAARCAAEMRKVKETSGR